MKFSGVVLVLLVSSLDALAPFQPVARSRSVSSVGIPILPRGITQLASSEDEETPENPYQDPNYPDLEFVNYNDPEYQVDQGVGDEFFDPNDTEEQVEAMREERRVRNDEYQFETYYKEVLKEGKEYKGEWTVFTTSTFLDDVDDGPGPIPRLKKVDGPLKVISGGQRIELESEEPPKFRLQNQRLLHYEKIFDETSDKSEDQVKQEKISMETTYWPEQTSSNDFRGQQGIMCVGHGYTICEGVPLKDETDGSLEYEGPFSEYRAELGIQDDDLRFRVKLDYAVKESDKSMELPPLCLRSFTVCRETLEMWPRADNYKSAIQALTDEVFFGPPGANGGLYDPPPVGEEAQAAQYMLLDLEGGATLLLPYKMDQDPSVHPDSGWVTSLDWTPGQYRYQLDRKVHGGKGLLGLRTLELSEVQSADADTYRPNDGGSDMRQ